MKYRLIKRLDQLDEKLKNLIRELEPFGQEALDEPAGPGQWSAMGALHHLRMAEDYAHKYIEKKLSFNPEIKKAGLSTAFRTLWMRIFFYLPIKMKAPGPVDSEAHPDGVTLQQLEVDWLEQRDRLRGYIAEMDDHRLEEEVYKHPFAGRLTLMGMLDFFEAHFDRHAKQAKRAVKNA